uniref:Uncharacterized protein n=1 Tax=Rhipicephalus appendiculatus TaxID=34631 RepID=A0A131Y9Q2_RHIAP
MYVRQVESLSYAKTFLSLPLARNCWRCVDLCQPARHGCRKCEEHDERCRCFLCEFRRACSPVGCGLSGSLSVCFYLPHIPLWVLAIINKAIIANESVHVPKLLRLTGAGSPSCLLIYLLLIA